MFSKNIIALISNKIQYFLYFVQKNHVTYFTVMKEPAFSYLGSMWASTPTNCAPIVLYEVLILVLIVGCDAHIAPKKFNEIALGAKNHLASPTGEPTKFHRPQRIVLFTFILRPRPQLLSLHEKKPRHFTDKKRLHHSSR